MNTAKPSFIFFFFLVSLFAMAVNVAAGPTKTFGPFTIELQANTDQCLTDCYAVLGITNSGAPISVPDNISNKISFLNQSPSMAGITSFEFFVEKTQTVQVPTVITTNKTVFVPKDANGATCPQIGDQLNDYNSNTCSKTEQIQQYGTPNSIQQNYWQPFTWGNLTIPSGFTRIKIVGHKKASLAPNNVDWVFTLQGNALDQWAWWNSSWTYKKQGTLTNNNTKYALEDRNFVVKITNFDTATLISGGKLQSNCNDLRITDTTETINWDANVFGCNRADTNIYFTWKGGNVAASGTGTFYLYYGNAAATQGPDSNHVSHGIDRNTLAVFTFNNPNTTTRKFTNDANTANTLTYDNSINLQTSDANHTEGTGGVSFGPTSQRGWLDGNLAVDSAPKTYTFKFKKTAGIIGNGTIMATRNSGVTTGWVLRLTGTTTLQLCNNGCGGISATIPTVVDNVWYTVAFGWDGTTGYIYWPGAFTSGAYTITVGSEPLRFGDELANINEGTGYAIDQFKIYSIAPNQLAGLMQKDLNAVGVQPTNSLGSEQVNTTAPNYLDVRSPSPKNNSDGNYVGNTDTYLKGADFNVAFSFQVGHATNGASLSADFNVGTTAGGGIGTVIAAGVSLNSDGRVQCTSTNWTTNPICTAVLKLNGAADNNYFTKVNVYPAGAIDTNIFRDSNKTFMLDRTAPATTLSGFTSNAWSTNNTRTFTLGCSDALSGCTLGLAKTTYRIDTNPALAAAMPSAWALYSGVVSSISGDGNWNVDFNSTDRAGNSEQPFNTKSELTDTNTPSTSNDANEGWRNANQTINLTCWDANGSAQTSGCLENRYRVNGGAYTTTALSGSPATVSFSVSTDGNNTFDYNSKDVVANAEAVKTDSIAIDKTAPVVGAPSITSSPATYTAGGITYVGPGTIAWRSTVSDALSGLGTSTCQQTANEGGAWTAGSYAGGFCSGTQAISNAIGYVLGNRISDLALLTGNIGTSSNTINYSGDTASPTTTDDVNTAWQGSNQTVNLSCNDGNGSGCAVGGTLYCVDTAGACTPSTVGTAVSVSCAAGQECVQYARYDSNDNLGNQESAKTSSAVSIDKNSPTIRVNNPADGNIFGSGQTMTVNVSDIASGAPATFCDYNVVSNGNLTKANTARTCNSTFTVSVNTSGGDCNAVGSNTCRIWLRAQDAAGNLAYKALNEGVSGTVNLQFVDENTGNALAPTVSIDGNDFTAQVSGGGLLSLSDTTVFANAKTYTITASDANRPTRTWQFDFNQFSSFDANLGLLGGSSGASTSFAWDFNGNIYANDFVEVLFIKNYGAGTQLKGYASRVKADGSARTSFFVSPALAVNSNTLRYQFRIFSNGAPDGNILSDFNAILINVKEPLDEFTDLNVGTYEIKIGGIYGLDENNIPGSMGLVSFFGLPETVSTYTVYAIDGNHLYASRQNSYQFDANTNPFSIQMFLVPLASSISTIFYISDKTTKRALPGAKLQFLQTVGGVLQIVQQGVSDSAGQVPFTGKVGALYYVNVFNTDGSFVKQDSINLLLSAYYLSLNQPAPATGFGQQTYLSVAFTPSGGALPMTGNVATSQIVRSNRTDINQVFAIVSQGDTNLSVQANAFTAPSLSISQSIPSGNFNTSLPVGITIIAQFTDGNVQKFPATYGILGSENPFDVVGIMRHGVRHDMGCPDDGSLCYPLGFLAFIASLGGVAGLAVAARFNNDALIAIAMIFLGFFTYVNWLPLIIYLFLVLIGFVAYFITRRPV